MSYVAEEVRDEVDNLFVNPRFNRETVALERRLSHKYVPGWSYLDSHEPVGVAVIRCRDVEVDEEDPCEYTTVTMIVEVHTDQVENSYTIMQAIRDSFGGGRCQHEWDCCGCWTTYVTEMAHATNNKWLVETRSSRNY